MIDTTKTIREVRYNGTAIPLLGGVDNPVVVTSDAEMEACLNDNRYLGMYVKFSGESENYLNGQVYKIAQEGEASKFYQLPTLDNEGTAADLATGKQLISSSGQIIIGAATIATENKLVQCLNKTITEITEDDLAGAINISTYAFDSCTNLINVAIPNSVTNIDHYAFYRCSNLTNITIPNSVTKIGNSTFRLCNSLTNIIIPDSVTNIGIYAFYNCSGLTSVTIGNGVTSIGDSAFDTCSGLINITLLPTTPPTLGSNVFNYISPNAIFTVPKGTLDAYKTATRWSTYANQMVEASN